MLEASAALSLPSDPAGQLRSNRFEFAAGRLSQSSGHHDFGVDYAAFRNMAAVDGRAKINALSGFGRSPQSFEEFAKTIQDLRPKVEIDELVFIDRSVDGWGQLLKDLDQQKQKGRNLDVILLDTDRNGIHQISRSLEQYAEVKSVHIVSHGSDGQVQLGNGQLNGAAWQGYVAELGAWGQSLAENADILFYGCNLTASVEGRQLARNVQLLTGADVAASSDLTGSVTTGGDWELEFHVGLIESTVILSASAQSEWAGTLQINIDQAWLDVQGSGPYYLDQAGETYVLQTDVTTDGSAFAIIAKDVVFDLNGHTVTYDNAAPISIANHSFEAGAASAADGWDFSAAPSAERYQGVWLQNEIYDGDYSLRFAPSGASQTVVSNELVTLDANTTYSMSGMFYKKKMPEIKLFVELENTVNGTIYRTEYGGTGNRGIQFAEEVFTTGNVSQKYQLRVGVDGSFDEKQAFIDDIKIQRTRTYGVAVSTFDWADDLYVDFTSFGGGGNAEVRNGNIMQGQDGGTWGHGILVRQAHNVRLENVHVTVSGANASAVYWWSGNDGVIENSQFASNVQTIQSRDNSHGAVVMNFQGTFADNLILNGPHVGLYLSDNSASQVYGNTIQLKSKYTNAFGIFAWGDGTEVYNNLIDCADGDYSARGIFIRGSSGTRRVYENTVRVQNFANNQEYGGNGGVQLGGAYGIQIESDSNAEIFRNRVFVNAEFASGYAFRANGVVDNVSVYENTFEVQNNGAHTAVFKFDGQNSSGLDIRDNTLITNDGLVGWTLNSSIDIVRSNLQITSNADTRLFETGWIDKKDFPGLHTTVRLIDSLFADQASRDAVAASHFVNYAGNRKADPDAEYSVNWSTGFLVKDLLGDGVANADVVVEDSQGNQVFGGTTDGNGLADVLLTEQHTVGDNKTVMGQYAVTAVSGSLSATENFLADQQQTIDVELDLNPPSHGDYRLKYQGATLIVDATDNQNSFYWSATTPLSFNIDELNFTVKEGTEKIYFRGEGGEDHINLFGSGGDDVLSLADGSLVLTTAGMKIVTSGIEMVQVELEGGSDAVYFNGTEGDDSVVVSSEVANFSGSGLSVKAEGFERFVARGSAGHDAVVFLDAVGNDRFFSYSTYSVMHTDGKILRADGFDSVIGRSEQGGFDTAKLFDSSGDDSLYTNELVGRMTDAEGSVRESQGFDRTIIKSSVGNDSAQLYGTDSDETALGALDSLIFMGDQFSYRVDGFSTVNLASGLGDDALYLSDTALDDVVELRDGYLSWSATDHSLVALQFETQVLKGVNGGHDSVEFRGSQGSEEFYSYPASNTAFMKTSGGVLRTTHFEQVAAYGNGGTDKAVMKGSVGFDDVRITSGRIDVTHAGGTSSAFGFSTTYTYLENQGGDAAVVSATTGDDVVVGSLSWLRAYGNGYSNFIHGFQSATVNAGEGNDAFYFKDSASDDQVIMRSGSASIDNATHSVSLNQFETQVVNSVNGGHDSLEMYDSNLDDTLLSKEDFTSMQNSQTFHRATGFGQLSVYANSGGVDTVEIHGTEAQEQIDLEKDYGRYAGGGMDRYFEGFDHADIYLDMAVDTKSETDVWFGFEWIDQ